MQSLNDLPPATRKRLVQLEELLKFWSGEKITSAKICELTGWKDSLVRHDLWLIHTVVEPVETTVFAVFLISHKSCRTRESFQPVNSQILAEVIFSPLQDFKSSSSCTSLFLVAGGRSFNIDIIGDLLCYGNRIYSKTR